ncbi:unnamed protein product [Caenorhabditis angaria]|uniref:Uncharacterized protein n=1 Tax=Caenorhabditis angaria TaxID=860376 RepID=A0A9P1J6G4_9PELO|nr:unnamed protein product [Caenorhabditis angaria]
MRPSGSENRLLSDMSNIPNCSSRASKPAAFEALFNAQQLACVQNFLLAQMYQAPARKTSQRAPRARAQTSPLSPLEAQLEAILRAPVSPQAPPEASQPSPIYEIVLAPFPTFAHAQCILPISSQASAQASFRAPRKRRRGNQEPSEPPAKLPTTTEIDIVSQYDIQFMESFMEEVKIPQINKYFGYHACFKIKRSNIYRTLQPELYMNCIDVVTRKCLSLARAENITSTCINFRFIHPELQKCFVNKKSMEMVNELIVAENENPKFQFDEQLQVHIEIVDGNCFKKNVLGENDTLLKAIAISQCKINADPKKLEILLRDEKQQDKAVLFLLETFDLMITNLTLQDLPMIAQKMSNYEIFVHTKYNGGLHFNNGQAKCITLVEINDFKYMSNISNCSSRAPISEASKQAPAPPCAQGTSQTPSRAQLQDFLQMPSLSPPQAPLEALLETPAPASPLSRLEALLESTLRARQHLGLTPAQRALQQSCAQASKRASSAQKTSQARAPAPAQSISQVPSKASAQASARASAQASAQASPRAPAQASAPSAPKNNPLKRAQEIPIPHDDLFFLPSEPWINEAKRLAEIDKLEFVNHQDILFMEDFMEEVKIPPIDISFGYHACFKIKRSIIFMTLQPELYRNCLDVVTRKCLSLAKAENMKMTCINFRFIHPQLPEGQLSFSNKTFISSKNIVEMVNELIVAEKQNAKFRFDEHLQVHIEIVDGTCFQPRVLGETGRLLKAILLSIVNCMEKTNSNFTPILENLLQNEQEQDKGALFLANIFELENIDLTLVDLPMIAEKLRNYDIYVLTKHDGLNFNNYGQREFFILVEINGRFDAVI